MYLETIDEKAFRSFLSNPAISVLDGNVLDKHHNSDFYRFVRVPLSDGEHSVEALFGQMCSNYPTSMSKNHFYEQHNLEFMAYVVDHEDGTPFSESIGKKFVAVQRLTQSRMLEFQSKPHCWESECRSLFAATAKVKNIRLFIEANGKEMQVQYPVSNLITFEMIKNKVISAWAIAPRKLSDEVKEFLAENCADYSKYWSDIPMKTVSRIESGRKVLWENPYFEGNRK